MKSKFSQLVKDFSHHYPGLTERRVEQEWEDYFEQKNFNNTVEGLWAEFTSQLARGRPFEYINHRSHFWGHIFYVDERVLIPRSETEILVDMALKWIEKKEVEQLEVCEVGVGSGAIFLSLLKETNKKINFTGGDISKQALEVAKLNYARQKAYLGKHQVELILSDRLESFQDQLFDLIISNPPYIKRSAVVGVHSQVLEFEPDVALFLADSAYKNWFESFFKYSYRYLRPDGALMLEGHELELDNLAVLAKQIGFSSVLVEKDLTGRERFLVCLK